MANEIPNAESGTSPSSVGPAPTNIPDGAEHPASSEAVQAEADMQQMQAGHGTDVDPDTGLEGREDTDDDEKPPRRRKK